MSCRKHKQRCGCLNFSQPSVASCYDDKHEGDGSFWEMRRGDSLVIDETVYQSDGVTPQNLTGWLMWFTVKYYFADPDGRAVWADRSDAVGTQIVFTFPYQGQAELTMPAFQTIGFPDSPVRVVYDVQVKDPVSSRLFTVDWGTILVRPDVTRAQV